MFKFELNFYKMFREHRPQKIVTIQTFLKEVLEEDLLKELKQVANKKGVPYQVLMRLLIADGLKRLNLVIIVS